MTKFNKTQFSYNGGYLTYDGKFVARFKHRGPFTKATFLKQLLANHTVEEYFSKLEAGVPPLAILRAANEHWYNTVTEKFRNVA
jgi:hypothetical protein